MVDYCNKCAAERGIKPTIDVPATFKVMTFNQTVQGYNCKGCRLTAIFKGYHNELRIGYAGPVSTVTGKPLVNFVQADINEYQ